jgi:hypothetical protein
MVALQTFKSSESIYCTTWHKTVEELNLQQHNCEKNKSGENNYAWLPCCHCIFYRQFGKLRSFTDLLPFIGTLNYEVMVALPPHKFSSPPARYYKPRKLDSRTFR